jgi:hypothetical protein
MNKHLLCKNAILIATCCVIATSAPAQVTFRSQATNITLSGTSNRYDWEMMAVKGYSFAAVHIDPAGGITGLTALYFAVLAKDLKSKNNKQRDNDTYKALRADRHPGISFVLSTATITANGNNSYRFICRGKMTVAGITRETTLLANGKYYPGGKIFNVSGVQQMKMTDYNIMPPVAVMGAIRTNNEISISYNLQFIR